jgi:hypothetical protein
MDFLKSALFTTALLSSLAVPAIANEATNTTNAEPRRVRTDCYMTYSSGEVINLGNLCEGASVDHPTEFSIVKPTIHNVTIVGDIAQGFRLTGELRNTTTRPSNRLTLYYAIRTDRELVTGTLYSPMVVANGRIPFEADLSELQGQILSVEVSFLD